MCYSSHHSSLFVVLEFVNLTPLEKIMFTKQRIVESEACWLIDLIRTFLHKALSMIKIENKIFNEDMSMLFKVY